MKKLSEARYIGIDKDVHGGMTDTGKIVRTAWAFDLIPEEETCEGWLASRLEELWIKTNDEWEKYGFLVSGLPDDIREKYLRIQADAVKKANAAGWSADLSAEGA